MRGSAGVGSDAGVAVSLPPAAAGVSVADCAAHETRKEGSTAAADTPRIRFAILVHKDAISGLIIARSSPTSPKTHSPGAILLLPPELASTVFELVRLFGGLYREVAPRCPRDYSTRNP